MNRKSFVWNNPAAYVAAPLLFAVLTMGILFLLGNQLVSPYKTLIGLFLGGSGSTTATESVDLLAAATAIEDSGLPAEEEPQEPEVIPLSAIQYPAKGDRYGNITISGTTVDAPVYYGDTNAILNKGAGTYMDDYRVGIPGESRTILVAGHNNTFFSDLQHVEIGATVTFETHYGTYTYEIVDAKVMDYQDSSAYDFTRTDENLILYTCYPFDAMGFTPNRYFVYAEYVSGPVLDANE